MKVGVDIGGTFTDLAASDDLGNLFFSKSSSTKKDLSDAIFDCMAKAELQPKHMIGFLHGSTIAINTIIEKTGAKTALITTKGFKDVLEIGRGYRVDSYNLFFKRPHPIIGRDQVFEVTERLDSSGNPIIPLDTSEAENLAQSLKSDDFKAVAVCFLNSYVNPVNEVRMSEILGEKHPNAHVSLSHNIIREIREYERGSTTVLNAYIGPRVSEFLTSLQNRLSNQGYPGQILLFQSNGGSMSLETAKKTPISLTESGPVAGVVGAVALSKLLNINKAVSFDMGGTTAKTSLITEYQPMISEGYYIGGYETGYPVILPTLDIVEVGAGGGSIAWVDKVGSLKVGPKSAGSEPGPACYNRGGDEPTVTDANLVLGRLNPHYFLGGEMPLDLDKATKAIQDKVANPLRMNLFEAALGIIKIADANMSLAVRAVSVERGHDPRDFAMFAYGGAGPLHSTAVAKEISIPTVIVPQLPGHFSALGMLLSDLKHDFVMTYFQDWTHINIDNINRHFKDMATDGFKTLSEEGTPPELQHSFRYVDLRYQGQHFSLRVPVTSTYSVDDLNKIRLNFDKLHHARYGHSSPKEPVETVNLRVTVVGEVVKPDLEKLKVKKPDDATELVKGRRQVYLDDWSETVDCPIYQRELLSTKDRIEGPAIIEENASTTIIYKGDVLTVNDLNHLVIGVS